MFGLVVSYYNINGIRDIYIYMCGDLVIYLMYRISGLYTLHPEIVKNPSSPKASSCRELQQAAAACVEADDRAYK